MEKEFKTGYGIASFSLAIVGMVCIIIFPIALFLPFIPLILSVLAIIFSSKQKKIEQTGFSVAGLVIGLIGLSISSIILVFWIFYLIVFGSLIVNLWNNYFLLLHLS